MSAGWLPFTSQEKKVCIGHCTIEPWRATNGVTVSMSNETSPAITTHHVRVSGCIARFTLVPGAA